MEISNSRTVAEREEEGTVVEIRDASGELAPGVSITVVGAYSDTYRKSQAANRDKMLKSRGRMEASALEQQSIDTIARCIKGWEGFTSEGKPFPFTRENAVALLTNAPWIREQLDEAIHDHAGFFSKPLAS